MRKLIETQPNPEAEEQDDLASRTDARGARKRSEAAWADFVKTLITISERQLLRLELGEELLQVVQDARKVTSPNAKSRALRLVRKEMRELDLDELRQRLEDLSHPSARRAPSALDTWRERLLVGGESAIDAFVLEHPSADRQRLRSLLRNAKKTDAPAQKKSALALTQALREALSEG
ncbi:MAG TPA: ribosome biogenesis factor YjgA [Polyangiaceae bacterium]|nr:ribosome biogenesis factor YjgA [Polyangiaceae bacterium]